MTQQAEHPGPYEIQLHEIAPSEFILVKQSDADQSSHIVLQPTPSSDPNDPLNWGLWRKCWNYLLVFGVSLGVFTALSTQTTFWQQMAVDLDVTFEQLNNSRSANLAGLAMGCIFFIPFTRKYGRRTPYVLSTMVMAGVSWWSYKMTSLTELTLTNLVFGLAGAINETLVQVTIADLFFVHQRGRANALYLLAVMMGSFLTPMAGGVQATRQGWRSSYLALAISMSIISVFFVFGYEETKYIPIMDGQSPAAPVAADKGDCDPQTKKTASELENSDLQAVDSVRVMNDAIPLNTYRQRMRLVTKTNENLWQLMVFPLRVVFLPHVMFTSLQYAACIFYLVIQSSVIAIVFAAPPYHFSPAGIGYLSLAPFIGNLLGSFYAGFVGDWCITYLSKKNNGWFVPEFRLYPLLLPVIAQSAGMMAFGITLGKGFHWIYPAIGSSISAFGLGAIGDVTFSVVIDAYRPVTAEAFVCVSFFRNAVSIIVPFVVMPWMQRDGLGTMFTIIGVLSFVIGMTFLPLIIWGKKWRDALVPYYNKILEKKVQIHGSV
ncbi:hypothetical protein SEUCBS139899_010897 [Sporothrix eucalyptigena]|uniref:Major facilitator superfamily (MFS) profile domain-containing protein n=1 Tax=Sporothrix eucalyptigena TaxID=1812306 RepID=A0ABP0D1K5_9PEZI